MVKFFGLTSKEFAENFTVSKKHEVRQDPESHNFQSPGDVLLCHPSSRSAISREPAVRKKLRDYSEVA
uniref:Period n=1 Tax=Ditylenchus dipsaci TaxID=166011 RepID=A0A915DTV7_9BILA